MITTDKVSLNLARNTFGDSFKGREVEIGQFPSHGMSLHSYWESGHRDYFKIVELQTGTVQHSVQQNGALDGKDFRLSALPEGFALMRLSYRGRHPTRVTIFLNPINMTKLLPPAMELSDGEKKVLRIWAEIISSYRTEHARYEGISSRTLEDIKESLKAKGLINGRNALTTDGKNAANMIRGA
jgi:hypothetical protein